jgi:hypothetical protein
MRMKMKRSEMEEMIFTTLMQCHMADISTTAISKILLRAIEDVGMLPPYYDPEKFTGQARGCVWEDEDEEK